MAGLASRFKISVYPCIQTKKDNANDEAKLDSLGLVQKLTIIEDNEVG